MSYKDISLLQKLLVSLHNMGAVSAKAGKTLDELAAITRITLDDLAAMVAEHINAGYVDFNVDKTGSKRYFLTGRGIIRVASLYT
ncbi:MAG: hypothetical protein QXP36_07190 [Conexivisphaerales archaeon]